MWLVTHVLGAITALSVLGNWRMLRDIEDLMVRRLAIKSDRMKELVGEFRDDLTERSPA